MPIINCPKIDIESRFEFIYLAEKYEFDKDSLIFHDDILLEKMLESIQNPQVNVILIDHNFPM